MTLWSHMMIIVQDDEAKINQVSHMSRKQLRKTSHTVLMVEKNTRWWPNWGDAVAWWIVYYAFDPVCLV